MTRVLNKGVKYSMDSSRLTEFRNELDTYIASEVHYLSLRPVMVFQVQNSKGVPHQLELRVAMGDVVISSDTPN